MAGNQRMSMYLMEKSHSIKQFHYFRKIIGAIHKMFFSSKLSISALTALSVPTRGVLIILTLKSLILLFVKNGVARWETNK